MQGKKRTLTAQPINDGPWYRDVTRYQWVVLVIASLGWIFDVFEGQIFVASMKDAIPSLVPRQTTSATIDLYNNIALAAFLLGGAMGGVMFGIMSDKIGRKRTMTFTIVMYSAFTFVSAFSQQWWHLAGFRFLVAMGVGGEWAVATALVADVFPRRARAWSLGIFHASSVLGTYLAVAAGAFIIGNPWFQSESYPTLPWRLGFLIGVFPALLIIWIRRGLREPESWEQARAVSAVDSAKQLGRISELFSGSLWLKTFIGVSLAAVGLSTFWGAHIYGKDLLRRDVERQSIARIIADADFDTATLPRNVEEAVVQARKVTDDGGNGVDTVLAHISLDEKRLLLKPDSERIKQWEMLGMLLVTTGGGLGLLSFGPLCERIGRRGAFLFFHLGGLVSTLIVFQFFEGIGILLALLPIFGYLTLGMHAGYAIYFPELFPTRLRSTGAGFCFNMGRIIAAPILILRGTVREWGLGLEDAVSVLSLLFLLGAFLLIWAPETKGQVEVE